MIHVCTEVNEIDLNQWEMLMTNSKVANFFQSKICYDFYASLTFLKPFIIAVSEDNKLKALMCGYLISNGNRFEKYFSRRAIVPGGILLDNNASIEVLQYLYNTTKRILSHHAIYVDIRNYNDYSYFKNSFQVAGFKYKSYLNFQLNTANYSTVVENINSSKKRQIKYSLNEGTIIEEAKNHDDISNFYIILKDLYKNKIKLPLFPFEFFEKLFYLENGKIIVVKYKGEIVGGIALVFMNNKVVYEWFVCGIENKIKRVYPSVLATFAGIQFATNTNCQLFDFMGAGRENEKYGVREFKSKFGGKMVEQGRFFVKYNFLLFWLGSLVINFKKK